MGPERRRVAELARNNERHADETERQAEPLAADDALAEQPARPQRGEQGLHADDQRRRCRPAAPA